MIDTDYLMDKAAPTIVAALGTALVLLVLGFAGLVVREIVWPSPPPPHCCCHGPTNPH